MTAPARAAAYRGLRLVTAGGADLGDALARVRDPLDDVRDRALATDLMTGTLRWRAAIANSVLWFGAATSHASDTALAFPECVPKTFNRSAPVFRILIQSAHSATLEHIQRSWRRRRPYPHLQQPRFIQPGRGRVQRWRSAPATKR